MKIIALVFVVFAMLVRSTNASMSPTPWFSVNSNGKGIVSIGWDYFEGSSQVTLTRSGYSSPLVTFSNAAPDYQNFGKIYQQPRGVFTYTLCAYPYGVSPICVSQKAKVN